MAWSGRSCSRRVVLGAILGATLIGIKLFRARYNLEPVPDSEALRITPQ